MSAESSRTTRPARRPVDACRLLGAMVSGLISGVAFDDVASPIFWRWGELHPEIAMTSQPARGQRRSRRRSGGYCVHALEAAIWAVAGADSFRSAVLRAANLGDDADTTAAIVGQLAGTRWGATAIPSEWRQKLVHSERIASLARNLSAAGGGGTVHAPGRSVARHHRPGPPTSWLTHGGCSPDDFSPASSPATSSPREQWTSSTSSSTPASGRSST